MIIEGLQKLTLLDYPGHMACVVYTKGCNFACPFCQNSSLITCDKAKGRIPETDIFEYLEKRKGILEGVVITGGEPLIQRDIKKFIKNIKDMGFLVKLDTNGSNPEILKTLIDEKLVDYVAMDIKNVFSKYDLNIGKKTRIENIERSIAILKEEKVDYEFRTTIIKEFNTIEDICKVCKMVGPHSKYFLQNFEDSSDVLNHSLHGFTHDELVGIKERLKGEFPNVVIRTLS